jgi:hypothetical protein
MKAVPLVRLADTSDAVVLADLPEKVLLAMADIAGAAREGLLAMSVAAGMAVTPSTTRKAPGTVDTADLDACRYMRWGNCRAGAWGTSCGCRSNSLPPGVAATALGSTWSRIGGRQPPSTFAARCQFA